VNREQHFDAVVIGAGTAGLTAATRIAQAGASVCVIAKGVGSTHLAPGTIDVLGYSPGRVGSPSEALEALIAADPDHPYALLGADVIEAAVEWLIGTAATGPQPGYCYTGGLDRNYLLPTAMGTLKPSAVVPETFAAGDTGSLNRHVVVGIPALRDFHPQLCASNLRAAGVDARAISIELDLDRADSSTLGLARRLDDRAWRLSFGARLAPLVRSADRVGLPAMLGLNDPHAVLSDLQDRLGRPVFEISTLPPSVPGIRLYELLRHSLRKAGGRLALGAGVTDHQRDGDRVTSVSAATAGSPTTYRADAFVLAAGGVHSGAITLDSHWQTHELIFGLPLAGLPGSGEPRFLDDYFAEQPMARVGVAVDRDLRAIGTANVFVAGASLPGAVPWSEASGEGIALASGYRAADVVAGHR
jgi:glycerol-3-phosphate dehydrogenase subunit B